MPAALQRVVARLLISPPDTVAVAGAVFVRNSRRNFITRAQEWDYFLGIASVKRQQGLFQGTMVAQCLQRLPHGSAAASGRLAEPHRRGVHAVLVNFVFPYVDVVFSIARSGSSWRCSATRDRRADAFTYQLFMSPVSVAGYTQELFGAARRW